MIYYTVYNGEINCLISVVYLGIKRGIFSGSVSLYIFINIHCKNRLVKITNVLDSTVARDANNYDFIGHTGCHVCMMNYN